jgi:hypothetical protein
MLYYLMILYFEGATKNHFEYCYAIVTIFFGIGSTIMRIYASYLKTFKFVDHMILGICVFFLEFILIIIAMLVCNYYESDINQSNDIDSWSVIISGVITSIAMGAQSGIASVAFPAFPNTTGMTASIAHVSA